MSLEINISHEPSSSSSTVFFDLLARGFTELLDLIGVPIIINNGDQKMCIARPAQIGLALEVAGRLPESKIQEIEMLATDFDLFNVVPNTTKCVIDGLTMTIMEVDRDPQDPCVRFNAVGVI